MLKLDCSSIWSLWRVLFKSFISVRDDARVSVCVITSRSTAATYTNTAVVIKFYKQRVL